MSDEHHGKRIGRIVGGRFVSDDEGPTEELTPETGFADPGAMIDERMRQHDRAAAERRALEQLETLEHVIASIDPEALTWDTVNRVADVNERLMQLFKAGVLAVMRGGR